MKTPASRPAFSSGLEDVAGRQSRAGDDVAAVEGVVDGEVSRAGGGVYGRRLVAGVYDDDHLRSGAEVFADLCVHFGVGVIWRDDFDREIRRTGEVLLHADDAVCSNERSIRRADRIRIARKNEADVGAVNFSEVLRAYVIPELSRDLLRNAAMLLARR